MEFRLAKKEDINSLYELEFNTFKAPWNLNHFTYEVNENEFSRTLVVYQDDVLIGYINYWIIFDQATINKVCVKEEFRRRGIAQKLFDMAFEDIKKSECMVCTLEVRISNEKAISFYIKNGFEKVLVKKAYYSDGEDAFYMVKGVL
jgi:ribosomal-protein-alanine N-acetyltransferase